jgi:hypothetical protein
MLKLSYFHISLAPLCYVFITRDNQLINWWKKQIDFVEMKFHLNIKILNDAAYNLNWIKFDFNWNPIRFRFD